MQDTTRIFPDEIRKGTRLAITRKDGTRIAGTARRRVVGFGADYEIQLDTLTGEFRQVESTEIARLQRL